MRIDIVTIGEPLPQDGERVRLLRHGILARRLADHGHQVVWWTSAFDHVNKRFRSTEDVSRCDWDGVEIVRLNGGGYRSNVSLARIRDHQVVARRFRSELEAQASGPALFLCSHPTAELCAAAAAWARARNIPVVIDVRDHWPDAFLDLLPPVARPPARLLMIPARRRLSGTFAQADALIGITEYSLAWGLRLAGRNRCDRDAVIPLACQPLVGGGSSAEVAAVEAAWRSAGVAPERNLVVAFFGTIGRQFALETVITAARILMQRGRPIQVLLCGTGDRFEHYRRLAADVPSIIMPGWMDQVRISGLCRLAHLGIAPYRNSSNFADAQPNKILEYLSAGLPIVSSLKGTCAELLARCHCGSTYPENGPEALADLLSSYQDDPGRLRAESAAATALYVARFTPDSVYGTFEQQLIRLAGASLPVAQQPSSG